MPSKKKKYNSRFPPMRIKKIMQSDEQVGKVAQVVPVIISKALEMFVQSLLKTSSDITRGRNARTLTPNHIKASILAEEQFHFLRDIAHTIPDVNPSADADGEDDTAVAATAAGTTPTATNTNPSYHRKASTTATSGLSATGQAAATGFRMRGRPRKRPLDSSTTYSSSRSMASTVDEPDDEDDEDDDEDADTDEADTDDDILAPPPAATAVALNLTNNNNNNNIVINNSHCLPTVTTHSSIPVSTIRSTGTVSAMPASAASSGGHSVAGGQLSMGSSMNMFHKTPDIDEDDDYDN